SDYGSASSGSRYSSYQIDNHAPLISMTDVRSQSYIPSASSSSSQGATRHRVAGTAVTEHISDEQMTRDTLVHSGTNSLAKLHEARQNSLAESTARNMNTHAGNTAPISTTSLRATMQASKDSPYNSTSRSGQVISRETGLPLSSANQNVPTRQLAFLSPVTYNDAELISKGLRAGKAVILDVRTTNPGLAKRILDFSFGAAAALDARVDGPADRVYAIARDGALTDSELGQLRDRGIL
ncbi:MAG: cell division protein SepF, partial [Coriobacteriales bacterium]|nr:cell division protein SepF [Coriobacteriales bacterium]